jgi:adenylate cyclase class 2
MPRQENDYAGSPAPLATPFLFLDGFAAVDLSVCRCPSVFVAKLYWAMPVRSRTTREVEIKLRVSDVPVLFRELRRLGAVPHGRVFEQNTLYDTPDSDFRRRGRMLRLRIETPAPSGPIRGGRRRAMITSKAAAPAGPGSRYKLKLEREALVRNFRWWHRVFRSIGLRPGFRYEKYRATFRLPGLFLDLDETPVGVFLELEGSPRAIDRVALALGFSPHDYVRETYWDLYAADSRRRGRSPRNMLFSS